MDALLPEDPQEENNTSITGTAMEEGERTGGDNLVSHHGTSQEGKQRERKGGGGGGIKEGEVGTEMKHREDSGGGSGKATAASAQAAGKGKHASGGGGGRKPRTKGLVKKLQEQVLMKY